MDTGKLSAWFFVLLIFCSNIPISAAATNSATLTYSGSATGNYTLNIPGTINASSVDVDIEMLGIGAGGVYDYWIEDTDYVFVPVSIPGSSNLTLYAEKISGYAPNGANTFVLFDDFDSYNSSIWDNSFSYNSISGGVITLTNTENGRLKSIDTFGAGYQVDWYLKPYDFSETSAQVQIGFGSTYDDSWNYGTSGCNAINFRVYTGTGDESIDTQTMNDGSSYITTTTRLTSWDESYNVYSSIYESTSSAKYEYQSYDWTQTSNVPDTAMSIQAVPRYDKANKLDVDWVRVRKYTTNEPSISVTDMGSYYEIEIQNNEATALSDYQVKVPASQIGVTSSNESLKISDSFIVDAELTASVIGDSQTQSFDENATEKSYSLLPSSSINEIQLTTDEDKSYNYNVTVNWENNAPIISNMSPSGNLDELQVTFSANVSDIDMGAGYDNLTIEFYVSDSLIDTVNVSESGYVTSGPYTYSTGGSYEWYIIATDEHGGVTQSDPETFNIPAQFVIRDAVSLDLVSTVDVDVMFYEQGELQQTVKKSTTTGGVNLTGLPVNSEFVVVVYADGYAVRNTLIESLYEQSSIYIIPNAEENNTVILEITDYTGNFPAIDSKILIQRSINVSAFDDSYDSGTYLWQTMSGDYIGADQAFQDTLLDNERYRFVVKNSDGESRVIGQYNSLDSESLNLVVGELEWEFSRDAGYYAEAWYVDTTDEGEIDNGIIRFQYYDDANLTSSLSVSCYERDNETNVIYTDSTSGTLGEYAASIPLTGEDQINTNWIVDYTIVRDGETLSFTLPISPDGGYMDWPIDGEMGALILGILVLFFALMFGGAVASKGAVILCALVAGIQFVGFYVAPWGVIIFVSAVSVLFLITDTSGDGIQ
jgi:hypothetical protein